MSRSLVVERVRRRLAGSGLTPASALPAAVEGRPDDFRLVDSRVVEGDVLDVRPVGAAEPCPEPLAFLDGIQRYEVVAFSGVHPVAVAEISAAVRLREGRDGRTIHRAERRLVLGAPSVLAALGGLTEDCDACPVEWDGAGPAHPLKALELIRQAIDRERGRLERDVGERFRLESDAWVVVDGVLSDSPVWADDRRAIGVSKSHATLPFSGDELVTYLRLPEGHRTSVFEPAMWRITPVLSWGLRLWPWEGQDLLHGLIRIEVAADAGAVARADQLSRWILAERVPLSRPDPRWDRLLYGVAAVERHLRGR
jgi:hypothetical protein